MRSKFDPDAIEAIYQAYPRHVGKAAALKAIGAALEIIACRNGITDPVEWLLDHVRTFARSPAGMAGKYCPHPATWMNQARYDDDPTEWDRESKGVENDGNSNAARPHHRRGQYDKHMLRT